MADKPKNLTLESLGYAAAILLLASGSAAAERSHVPLAIAEFSYVDTSGEVRDQAAKHRGVLEMFSRLLHEDVEKSGKFVLAKFQCSAPECAVMDGAPTAPLVTAARAAGARYLVSGGIQKMSTLVQNARLVVLDIETGKHILDRLFTFRGDNEEAWRHAALFVARHITIP
jgi:hypothetical protein